MVTEREILIIHNHIIPLCFLLRFFISGNIFTGTITSRPSVKKAAIAPRFTLKSNFLIPKVVSLYLHIIPLISTAKLRKIFENNTLLYKIFWRYEKIIVNLQHKHIT